MGDARRRRSRRSSYQRWRRQSWWGIGAVCTLLLITILLRILTFSESVDDQQLPDMVSQPADTPALRLRQAFAQRDLGRILLACHAAWDRQLGELVPAVAMAWQSEQLDLYAAEGRTQWRHYWCRESGVGRGRASDRPEQISGHVPLPSEQLVYRFSGLVADARLRALEALGDGHGRMQVRLHWDDGRVSGEFPEDPTPDFLNLRMSPVQRPAAEAEAEAEST